MFKVNAILYSESQCHCVWKQEGHFGLHSEKEGHRAGGTCLTKTPRTAVSPQVRRGVEGGRRTEETKEPADPGSPRHFVCMCVRVPSGAPGRQGRRAGWAPAREGSLPPRASRRSVHKRQNKVQKCYPDGKDRIPRKGKRCSLMKREPLAVDGVRTRVGVGAAPEPRRCSFKERSSLG